MLLKLFQFILPISLTLIGSWQAYYYFTVKKYFSRMTTVKGKVTHSKLLDMPDLEGNHIFQAQISVEYEFEGKKQETDEPALRASEFFPNKAYEKALVEKYKVGDEVELKAVPGFEGLAYTELVPWSLKSIIIIPVLLIFSIAIAVSIHLGFWEGLSEYVSMKLYAYKYNATQQ